MWFYTYYVTWSPLPMKYSDVIVADNLKQRQEVNITLVNFGGETIQSQYKRNKKAMY